MSEMILPGTFIEVRAEGLIRPGAISVGNLGVVGTAQKGPIGIPVILGSYTDTLDKFGSYDPWVDGDSNELTLVRALQLAYQQGATTVYAVRVAGVTAKKSAKLLTSAGGENIKLIAKTEGKWGDELQVNVFDADANPFIEDEVHEEGGNIILKHGSIVKSARNRIIHKIVATGVTRSLKIYYDGDTDIPNPLGSGNVLINRTTKALTFGDGNPVAGDVITAFYTVEKANAVKVTIRLHSNEEVYNVVSGDDLEADIKRLSLWIDATKLANSAEIPTKDASKDTFASFTGGDNGEIGADYQKGLESLINEPVHIILAAGQDNTFGDELAAHCRVASSDDYQRERIALVGSKLGATVDQIRGHILNSDRLIFVAPGIQTKDNATSPPADVTLPGSYAAAAIAGLLSSMDAHTSPTNKTVDVGGLEKKFTKAELAQIVQSRVFVLEQQLGIKIVRGLTTATDSAFKQITTRRIVDYAKFGVRSAADPFIGKLNNERVRQALKASVNSLLVDMIDREMLTAYKLEVSASRDQEIRGIAQITMTLQPTFSIDFIRVVMVLQ